MSQGQITLNELKFRECAKVSGSLFKMSAPGFL